MADETTPDAPQSSGLRALPAAGGFVQWLRSPFFWFSMVVVSVSIPVLVKAYRSANPTVGAPLSEIPAFALKDQENQPFTRDSMLGHVSLVNFIFTSCPDVCPLLTQQMARVQELVKARGLPYRFLSISVDPDTDTPAVLKAYGLKYGADYTSWSFVTGPLEDIQKVIIEGFKVGLDRGETPAKHTEKLDPMDLTSLMDITHGEQFVVVDSQARIRAYRTAHNSQDIEGLLAIARIVDEKSSAR